MNVSSPLFQNLKQFWSQKEVQPGTSEVYLLKWPMSAFLVSLSITVVISNNEIQQENKSTNKEQHQMQKKEIVCYKNHVEKTQKAPTLLWQNKLHFG